MQNLPLSKIYETAILLVEIFEGYTFRNIIEYTKSTNVEGNFRFSPDGIRYRQSDAHVSVLNDIFIPGDKLSKYYYRVQNDEIIVGLKIADLKRLTKPIGKKNDLLLYILPDDPLFYIHPIGQATTYIRPQHIELSDYPLDGCIADKTPNCVASITEFVRMCNIMNSVCNSVTFRAFPRGIRCEGVMEGSLTGSILNFGYIEPNMSKCNLDPKKINKMKFKYGGIKSPTDQKFPTLIIQDPDFENKLTRVKIATIRSLGKLGNISGNGGTVKFFYIPKIPGLRLDFEIGNYGNLSVYLKDIPNLL